MLELRQKLSTRAGHGTVLSILRCFRRFLPFVYFSDTISVSVLLITSVAFCSFCVCSVKLKPGFDMSLLIREAPREHPHDVIRFILLSRFLSVSAGSAAALKTRTNRPGKTEELNNVSIVSWEVKHPLKPVFLILSCRMNCSVNLLFDVQMLIK